MCTHTLAITRETRVKLSKFLQEINHISVLREYFPKVHAVSESLFHYLLNGIHYIPLNKKSSDHYFAKDVWSGHDVYGK